MKLYKVTLDQYKTLQQTGSIIVGGVTYTYNEDDIYVVIDPWAPEYRLNWNSSDDQLQITKDGEVASQVTVGYATSAGHANNAAAIVGDGTEIQASELKAVVNTYVSKDELSSTISQTVSSVNKQISLVEDELTAHQGNKNNPHSVTKAQVGLGSVINAGQTTTPKSGSNSYFTAGGAYTLRESLNDSIEDATLQANQQWGGPDIPGALSPIEAVANPASAGANKLAFCKTDGVTIEYSTDGGSTWNDYQATYSQITNFFNGLGSSFTLGKKGDEVGSGSVQDKLRITMDANAMDVYFKIRRLLVNVSTNGASGLHVDIEKATIGAPDTFVSVRTGIRLSGWSGWNSFSVGTADIFGGTSSFTTQTQKIRLTFGITGVNPTSSSAAKILAMTVICDVAWRVHSNLANNGHLYSYDYDQNAFFPSNVTVKGLKNAAVVGTDANGRLKAASGNLFLYDDLGNI